MVGISLGGSSSRGHDCDVGSSARAYWSVELLGDVARKVSGHWGVLIDPCHEAPELEQSCLLYGGGIVQEPRQVTPLQVGIAPCERVPSVAFAVEL